MTCVRRDLDLGELTRSRAGGTPPRGGATSSRRRSTRFAVLHQRDRQQGASILGAPICSGQHQKTNKSSPIRRTTEAAGERKQPPPQRGNERQRRPGTPQRAESFTGAVKVCVSVPRPRGHHGDRGRVWKGKPLQRSPQPAVLVRMRGMAPLAGQPATSSTAALQISARGVHAAAP